MKKTITVLTAIMPLILFSCFEFVGSGTSKRLLNLFLTAPADVAKIHVAVFDGALTPDRVIYKQSFAAGSSIPLDLPAGDNRYIVVWGESFAGTGNYFGSIGPVTIRESENVPLPIQMTKFYTDATTDAFNLQGNSPLTWNSIPGAITYSLQYPDGHVQIVSGSSAEPESVHGYDVIIRVLTSVFDISSDASNSFNYG